MRVRVELESGIESHRRELKAYCRRMLGSPADAEDAVQETLLRAWRAADGFQGRATMRTWLYRIAHNVCVDEANRRAGRPVPIDDWDGVLDQRHEPDPADVVIAREGLRLALSVADDHLPRRQRDALVLRDLLCLRATEVADALQTSVPAMQRAHAAMCVRGPEWRDAQLSQ
jgi:RNA polymerase sigma-70 factor (ECF subfamily)